jgi:hypothetical protein
MMNKSLVFGVFGVWWSMYRAVVCYKMVIRCIGSQKDLLPVYIP